MGIGPGSNRWRDGLKRIAAGGTVWLAAALLVASCSRSEQPAVSTGEPERREILALVNDEPLYLERFNNKFELSSMAHFVRTDATPEKAKELKKVFLNQLIDRILLLQEAKRRNVTVPEAELAGMVNSVESEYGPNGLQDFLKKRGIDLVLWRLEVAEELVIQKLLEVEVNKNVEMSEEEITRQYKENAQQFVRPRMVRALQILVATEKEAKEARRKLLRGTDFSKLASQISMGPEAQKGGDLGYFEEGVMPEGLDDTIFSLKKGSISKIVKSSYGYHIFKVVDEKKESKLKIEEVKEEIRSGLVHEKQKTNYQRFIDQLKADSKVKINYKLIDRNADPMPQGSTSD